MFKTKKQGIVLAVVVFVIGSICGVFIDRIVLYSGMFPVPFKFHQKSREKMETGIINKFTKMLQLTGEQKDKLAVIFRKHKAEMDKLAKIERPRFKDLRNKLNEEIKTILTDNQKVIFEKMTQQHKERQERRPFPEEPDENN